MTEHVLPPDGEALSGEVTLHKGDTIRTEANVRLSMGGFGFGRLVIRWEVAPIIDNYPLSEAMERSDRAVRLELRALGCCEPCLDKFVRHALLPGLAYIESGEAGEALAAVGIKPTFAVDAPGR